MVKYTPVHTTAVVVAKIRRTAPTTEKQPKTTTKKSSLAETKSTRQGHLPFPKQARDRGPLANAQPSVKKIEQPNAALSSGCGKSAVPALLTMVAPLFATPAIRLLPLRFLQSAACPDTYTSRPQLRQDDLSSAVAIRRLLCSTLSFVISCFVGRRSPRPAMPPAERHTLNLSVVGPPIEKCELPERARKSDRAGERSLAVRAD